MTQTPTYRDDPGATHPHATLPGHDPSKVRGYTAPDCITASKCEALDVRVLKVAEWLLKEAYFQDNTSLELSEEYHRMANTLHAIAAEIRDAATPPSSRTLCGLLSDNKPLPDQLRTASEQLRGMLMGGELEALPESTRIVFVALAVFLNGAAARVGGE